MTANGPVKEILRIILRNKILKICINSIKSINSKSHILDNT